MSLLDRTDFELPSYVIETPQGTKKITFDVDGDIYKMQAATEKSQSLQEIKEEQDDEIKKIQHLIDMDISPEYNKERLKAYPKMMAELERQSTLKASAESDNLAHLQGSSPGLKSESQAVPVASGE